MANRRVRLTRAAVEAMPSNTMLWDSEVPGLFARRRNAGVTYGVFYRADGRQRWLKLGQHGVIAPDDARKLARARLGEVAGNRDPQAEKKARRQRPTDRLGPMFELFLQREQENLSPRTFSQYDRSFRHDIEAKLGSLLIHEITKRDLVPFFDKLAVRAPAQAAAVFRILRRFFNWLVARDLLPVSPMSGMEPPAVVEARERVLSDEELREIWQASDQLGFPFDPFVKLLVLTGQRRSEVAGLRRAELDPTRAVWTIPGTRTKNSKAHDVPLSRQAVMLIARLHNQASGDFLLGTTGTTGPSGFSKAKTRLDELIVQARGKAAREAGQDEATVKPMEEWRWHDLRRTVSTGLQRLGVRLEVTEATLNHISGSRAGIVGVYQRHDWQEEKAAALQAWADHIATLEQKKPNTSNVVRLADYPRR